jgi:AraC-like DNA-binding protein
MLGPMASRARERLFLRTASRQVTWPEPDRASSLFAEAVPEPALREHVAKIRWGYEWIPPESPVQERIVPDGAVHLLFAVSTAGGARPYGLAIGASSEPSVVQLSGHIEHVEIELQPGAVPALLGVPAGEISGQAVALEDLWRDRAATVRDRLLGTRDPGERIRIVHETLAAAIGERAVQTPPALAEALRRITRARGRMRVRELADGLGISDRRLEQLFHCHVGLSPKATCRLARFRGSVELLARAARRSPSRSPARSLSWAEIALDSGFSDQSHLVNEFRALTGLAPRDFQRRAGFGFLQDRADRGR